MDYSHLIVGGGMFGCHVALRLAELHADARIAIVEREPDLLRRASYNNQARVHNGYHYPRSILTGLRSRVNAPRFLKEFQGTICTDFKQYYAIARRHSNVTAAQFETFCRRIGAELRPAPKPVRQLLDDDLIEAVYAVTEPIFDADKLRALVWERLRRAGIAVMLDTEAVKVNVGGDTPGPALSLDLRMRQSGEGRSIGCARLFNCTYSKLNALLGNSGLRTIRLRHEAAEMALIALPPALSDLSITVMCGPFFSLMPFPAKGLATLSHVSYTPHYSWTDDPGAGADAVHEPDFPLHSRFGKMWRDAARYLPALKGARYVESLWEVKTILPQSDANDSRPILFKRDPAAPNVISLLGGKIDNIYDLDELFAGVAGRRSELSPA
jgi:glycine/D-amino acid oxidase-like deaminating enzyme